MSLGQHAEISKKNGEVSSAPLGSAKDLEQGPTHPHLALLQEFIPKHMQGKAGGT